MARRFFTSDWHLGMTDILRFEERPFQTIEQHDSALLLSAMDKAGKDDTIIHIGDLCSFKSDRGSKGLSVKPDNLVKSLNATFINIRGNHDVNNRVKSLCESMRLALGKQFTDVSASHYPSYDPRVGKNFRNGDIHLCGHVHRKWKHCLDLTHQVLNINVGVDVWNFQIVSEEELISYIMEIMNSPASKINKIEKTQNI